MSSVDSNHNGMLLASLDQHGNSICLPSSSSTSVDNNANETIGKFIEVNCTSYFNIYNICGCLHSPFDFKNKLLLSVWKLSLVIGLVVLSALLIVYMTSYWEKVNYFIYISGSLLQCVTLIPIIYVVVNRLQNEIITLSQKFIIKDAEYRMKINLTWTLICISITFNNVMSMI